MTEIASRPSAILFARLARALQTVRDRGRRFWEFFTLNIRNPNTRRAYFTAVASFAS